ncbi:MAG: Ig-like domain-containing protein [Lachnospiraceae bacterium]|nr:Ig-like domain-containing protein [Lachnospiraceae bacterium]
MKKRKLLQRLVTGLCTAVLTVTSVIPAGVTLKAQAAAEHTLWIVGDSTVCSYIKEDGTLTDATYYYPRYGYGTQIGNYLDGSYDIQNLALSGRSSKSFTTEENYKTLTGTNGMKKGDVLIVGFGHNDEKSDDAARFTTAAATDTYETEGSFAKSLYDNYVVPAQNAGTEVILCTPIVRRNANANELTNSNCHITSDGDYPEAIRKLGTAKGISVVDLTALTKAKWEALGKDENINFHAWLNKKPESADDTHLNIYGAKEVAYMFANAAKSLNGSTFATHVKAGIAEPVKATDLVANKDYKDIVYSVPIQPDDKSALWEDYSVENGLRFTAKDASQNLVMYGTAFGSLGSAPTKDNYVIGADADGSMNIVVKNNKGKVAAKEDGFAMYYYQIPAGRKFIFKATAKLNNMDLTNTQGAFGITARDAMWIDVNDKTLVSDYVVAGSLGTGCNCFYRKSGALGGKAALNTPIVKGNSYDLSIVYNGDGFTCKFGDEEAQSGGYDFQLLTVDSEYVYVGCFSARNADVTFSNIYLEVEGEEPAPPVKPAKPDEGEGEGEGENGGEGGNEPVAPVSTPYTISYNAAGGTLPEGLTVSANEGDVVELKDCIAPEGYKFKSWTLSGNTVSSNYTVSGNDAVEGTITFTAAYEKTEELEPETPDEPTPIPVVNVDGTDTVSVKKIDLGVKGAQTMNVGAEATLKAAVTSKGSDASVNKVNWVAPSGHVIDTVVQADGSLKVKAVGPGTAFVTAVCGGKSKTVKYTVKQPVNKAEASLNEITLSAKEKYRICVNLDAATTDKFFYATNDKNVCAVNGKGIITAKAVGTTTVDVFAGEKKNTAKKVASVKVTVKDGVAAAAAVKDVSINYVGNKTLFTGEMGYISTLVNGGANNGGQAVKYTYSAKGIVKVDAFGRVTAKKAGKVTVTATCGTKSASIELIVKQPLKLFKINRTYVKVKSGKAKNVTFSVKTNPALNKSEAKVSFAVANTDNGVKKVSDANGKAVFAVSETAKDTVITATITDAATGNTYVVNSVIDVK